MEGIELAPGPRARFSSTSEWDKPLFPYGTKKGDAQFGVLSENFDQKLEVRGSAEAGRESIHRRLRILRGRSFDTDRK
jgi:hypothetical protein